MINLIRLIVWFIFIAIVMATIGPIELRPQTGGAPSVQQFSAFLIFSPTFAAAYPKHVWLELAFVLVAILVLEFLQNIVPGRHSRIADTQFKAAGTLLGFGINVLLKRGLRRLCCKPHDSTV